MILLKVHIKGESNSFQITAIVLAAVYKQQAETHTKEFFQHTLRKYYTTKEQRDAVTLSWDFMMAEVIILSQFVWSYTVCLARRTRFLCKGKDRCITGLQFY